MSSTFSQIYIQIVFAVSGRRSLINEAWENNLYRYITGIVQKKDQKMLAINGMPDHIHMVIGMKPSCCLSDLVRDVKKSSNEYIQENRFSRHFQWQNGFGAFSYSQSDLTNVINYVLNQKQHHKSLSFKEEYFSLLRRLEIRFEEKYLFDFLD